MSEYKDFDWFKKLDNREQKEIEFAATYAREFHHGTDGHNRLMLLSKLADNLCDLEEIQSIDIELHKAIHIEVYK